MNNEISRKEQKQEAIKRLKTIGIMEDVINAFEKDVIYVSERVGKLLPAVLYLADSNEQLMKEIKDAEERYGICVYHVQLTHTVIGDMFAMLYVSKEQEEWEYDNVDLGDGYPVAYVWNGDVREFGSIGIKVSMGGIERTA